MNADTETTLDQFYAAVVNDIRAAFPVFATVEFDREDRENIPLPAVLLEISEFEDANDMDPGSEQWSVDARVEALVLLGFREAAVKMEVRKAATALAVWLRKRRFSHPSKPGKKLPTGEVRLQGCYKDDFNPELDQYEIWRVEWTQNMTLGPSVWAGETDGTTPTPVYSWAPAIGTGNEDQYNELDPLLGLFQK